MAHTVLGTVSLGYQLLWNPLRQLAGVQLFIGTEDEPAVDAPHLLGALDAVWSAQSPPLLLSATSPQLLAQLLACATDSGPWLTVAQRQLRDPAMAARVQQAHQRGVPLIWHGEPGARPDAALAPCFGRQLLALSASEALTSLRVSLRQHNAAGAGPRSPIRSPVLGGQIYEALTSRVLAEHCLDQQAAWAVAGWPLEDVLHGYRHQRIQPGQQAITQLIATIDAEASVEHLELMLREEPLLAYRFLRYVNSASVGLRTEITSIRHGLMVLGLSPLRAWLLEQQAQASHDRNLRPVQATMVLRARLMEQLLDAGDSHELRRELFMCGLLSQLDLLLGEPLPTILARLPLSERITAALLGHAGPYLRYLELATALESAPTSASRRRCQAHQMDLEAVNHRLLRTLSHASMPPVRGGLTA